MLEYMWETRDRENENKNAHTELQRKEKIQLKQRLDQLQEMARLFEPIENFKWMFISLPFFLKCPNDNNEISCHLFVLVFFFFDRLVTTLCVNTQ